MTSEYLNIMPGEYVAISAEPGSSEEESKYWGYTSWNDFQHMQAGNHQPIWGGLQEKSGLSLSDLVELLQTTYMNPRIADPKSVVICQDNSREGSFRLTHLDGTSLTIDDWTRIRRFAQLWRKTGWRVSEVDQAISGLGGAKGRLGIGADILPQIVAVMKLTELMDLEREILLAFWASITINSDKDSLYARLFLSHHIVSIDPIFAADPNGNFPIPTRTVKISEHETVVEATLGLTKEGLDAIKAKIEPASDSDRLSMKNISTLYGHAMLAKFLCVPPVVLLQAIEVFKIDPFSSATSCLEFVESWKGVETAGFSFAQFRYTLTGNDDLLKPLGPSKVAMQRAIKRIQDSHTTQTGAVIVSKVGKETMGGAVLTVDLMFTILSEVSDLSVEILRVLLPGEDL